MSLCMPYVCIVSLRVLACIITWALGILMTCFINEPQIDKVTVQRVIFTQRFRVKHYKTLFKCCILLLLLVLRNAEIDSCLYRCQITRPIHY